MATFSNGESGLSVRTKINNVLQHADGTASELVINDAGADVNFRVESDTDANALFVDGGTGNVGIGTSSPTNSTGYKTLSLNGTTGGQIEFQTNTVGSAYIFHDGVNGNLNLFNSQAGNTIFLINGTERMRIDSSGNVGIGTSSPSEPLDVAGGKIRIGNTKIGHSGSGGSWDMTFETYSGGYFERMRIDSSGNVGIGTSSPQAKLQVLDTLKVSTADQSSGSVILGDGGSTAFNVGIARWNGATNAAGAGGVGYFAQGSSNAGGHFFYTGDAAAGSTTERMRIDASGNLLLAGTGTPTSSAGNLVIYNGTAPTGNATNGVILYAEDVSASSELKVRDEAGNVTTLSPHNFDLIPEGPSEDMAWSYYSERDGKRINVDMLKAIRLLEQISGEKLVHMV